MKKEASKELVGQRVAFGETIDEYGQSQATARKIGTTLHGPGHYEAIHWGTSQPAKSTLPEFRQEDSRKA